MTTTSLAQSLATMTSAALAWLQDNREHNQFPDEETRRLRDLDHFYKPLGETALGCYVVLREEVGSGADLERARSLLGWTWQRFRHGDVFYERVSLEPLLTDPLEMYGHYFAHGYRHAGLDRVLPHLSRLRSVRAVEQYPNRRLSSANAARSMGIERADDWSALTASTWLGATPEPWLLDWMGAYNVTHTVFHLSDWGAHPHGIAPPLAAYLHDWLPVWADVWSETAQWDLLGELLYVGACLPEPWIEPAAWQPLLDAQRTQGFLPRDAGPLDDDPAVLFGHHQHPTVVAVMAATVARARLTKNTA